MNPWDDAVPFEAFYQTLNANSLSNELNSSFNLDTSDTLNNIEEDDLIIKLKLADVAAHKKRERASIEQKKKIYSEMKSYLTNESINNITQSLDQISYLFKIYTDDKLIQSLTNTIVMNKRNRYVNISKPIKDKFINIMKLALTVVEALESNHPNSFEYNQNILLNNFQQFSDELHDVNKTLNYMEMASRENKKKSSPSRSPIR